MTTFDVSKEICSCPLCRSDKTAPPDELVDVIFFELIDPTKGPDNEQLEPKTTTAEAS